MTFHFCSLAIYGAATFQQDQPKLGVKTLSGREIERDPMQVCARSGWHAHVLVERFRAKSLLLSVSIAMELHQITSGLSSLSQYIH